MKLFKISIKHPQKINIIIFKTLETRSTITLRVSKLINNCKISEATEDNMNKLFPVTFLKSVLVFLFSIGMYSQISVLEVLFKIDEPKSNRRKNKEILFFSKNNEFCERENEYTLL